MENIKSQARQLLQILTEDSETDLVDHADEFLLFLNRLSDASKKYPSLVVLVNSFGDIIHGLESNPQEILSRPDVHTRLTSLFTMLA